MRILVLCTDAYGGHGGIALYNRDLIDALSVMPGCDEIVVIPRVVPRVPGPIPSNVRFEAAAAAGPLQYGEALLRARRQRFDVVICGHVNLLRLMRLFSGVKLLFVHGIDAWKPWRSRAGGTANEQLRHIDAIVAVSEITRSRLLDWSGFPGPTHILRNAIRMEEYGLHPPSATLLERYELAGRRVLLTVGRLVDRERYKGHDEVIEILGDLPDDVVYLVAGGGNDLARLQAKSEDLGVGGRVRFTGDFPDSMKTDIYAASSVYVMPSRGEGFGRVFHEALACGLPAIGSKHDGGREALLDGRLGILVDPASPAELRSAILEQLEAPRMVPLALRAFAHERLVEQTHAMIRTCT